MNDKKQLGIHYNCFQSIKEQLDEQNMECKDIEQMEKLKDYIMYLYVHSIITEKEQDNACKRLHKLITKNTVYLGGKEE